MDHRELIAEMAYIEKLSTQERLKLARRRRIQQLKKHHQLEKESLSASKREKTKQNEAYKRRRQNSKRVVFVSSVMLLEAAARNDIDEVRELLQSGSVSPNATNEDGLTALHQCCIDDSAEMLTLLLHYGADVNAADSEKWTPLHAAATCGHLHLAQLLVQHGANLLAVNADGNMPYDICEDDATLDYIECEMARRGVTQAMIDETRTTTETAMLDELKLMRDNGESLLVRDHQNATPLHVAAANGYMRVCEFLLSHNFPLELRDADDWTPLHAAACWGHPDVLELLVLHGANLHARNKHQETPYDICEDQDLRERLLQLLTEQETRRLGDHRGRIRRGHSANTRTQSVRRTSIREKCLATKREAQEEARMRLSGGATSTPNGAVINGNNLFWDNKDDSEVNDMNSDAASDDGKREDELVDEQIKSSDVKEKDNVEQGSTDDVDSPRYLSVISKKTHEYKHLSDRSEDGNSTNDANNSPSDHDSVERLSPRQQNESPPLGYSEASVRRTSVSRSALSVSKKPKQESDYGSSFYNRSWEDTESNEADDVRTVEPAGSKIPDDEEEIYYDDSVNSGYSNSDLVLSHFGPNADAIKKIQSLSDVYVPNSRTPSSGYSSETVSIGPHTGMKDVTDSPDLSTDKLHSQSSIVTNFPSVVTDRNQEAENALQGNANFSVMEDVQSRTVSRQMWVAEDNCERSSEPDIGQGSIRNMDGGISPFDRSNERGLLTNAEDSVVPLLDPQPDLIPESARRKPAPKPPQKPPNLIAGISPLLQIANTQSKPISSTVIASASRQSTVTVSHATQVSSNMEMRSTSAAAVPPPPSELHAKLDNVVTINSPLEGSLALERRSLQTRPVPPPRTSSIKSDDGEQEASAVTTITSKATEHHTLKEIAEPRLESGYGISEVSIPESQLQVKSPAIFDSQLNSGGNNAIDIHVTVTVKPLAPGTLADLKQQRALSRGPHTSPSSGDGGSVASGTLGRASGDAVGPKALDHTSQVLVGNDNFAYDGNSVGGEVGQSVSSERPSSTATSTLRTEASPAPRRKYTAPSVDYPAPPDSRSCCVLL
ncbi:protein phosphatase 1 regulatory subunit 12B [Hyalella azteca]|uniref:Protein phosphatase 1 regulatory subunit 12B n=1 Tax=Hyalella azteca TaxID=294128 RepID=A0A8B7NW26_HYAAZ|nr:protein phosphatase 1 regulatory subunit 12B [Hyalella azteca]